MAGWANLPEELLTLIVQCLSFLDDVIIFGAVCKSWQSAIASEEKPSLPPKFPLLMLIEKRDKEGESSNDKQNMRTRRFLNLFESNVYKFKLPEATFIRCLGAGFGRLLTLGTDLQINLLHPFTKHQICLPPNPTFDDLFDPEHPAFGHVFYHEHLFFCYLLDLDYEPQEFTDIFIRKAVLSSNPWKKITLNGHEKHDCVVMAIFSKALILAFARLGDKFWTKVQVPKHYYQDIIHYKDQFYAIDRNGVLVVCDIDDDQNPRATVIAPAPYGVALFSSNYLVESSGDLLLVSRARNFWFPGKETKNKYATPPYWTCKFLVLKLEQCTQVGSRYGYRWVGVNNLGDRSLFLGGYSSMSLPASDVKGCCKANCIYFTDDIETGDDHDMCAFYMEDGRIERYCVSSLPSYCSMPFWYI